MTFLVFFTDVDSLTKLFKDGNFEQSIKGKLPHGSDSDSSDSKTHNKNPNESTQLSSSKEPSNEKKELDKLEKANENLAKGMLTVLSNKFMNRKSSSF